MSGATNNKGQIVFDDFKNGDYSIKASAIGYIASMPMSVSVKNKTEVVIKLNPTTSEAPKVDSNGSGPDQSNTSNPSLSTNYANICSNTPSSTKPTRTNRAARLER